MRAAPPEWCRAAFRVHQNCRQRLAPSRCRLRGASRPRTRQCDVDLAPNEPTPVAPYPLRGVAPTDQGRTVRTAEMSHPCPSLIGQRPLRAHLDTGQFTLVDEFLATRDRPRIRIEQLLVCFATRDQRAQSATDLHVLGPVA